MVKCIVVKSVSLRDRFMDLKGQLASKDKKDYSDENVLEYLLNKVS